jgi:hypothetical protein
MAGRGFQRAHRGRPFDQILDGLPNDKPPLEYYVQAVAGRLIPNPEFSHRLPEALAWLAVL